MLTLALLVTARGRAAGPTGGCQPELRAIALEDQKDRAGAFEEIDWKKVGPRDLNRRIRVATLFAEGCFHDAADYAAAAMVFQHGTTADHYYQAFLWAHEAVKRGDPSQRWLMAAALDRHLVATGRRQLFGTQFGKDAHGKWCLQPVEASFPERRRIEFTGRKLKAGIAHALEGLGAKSRAEALGECRPLLKDTPKGSLPGFW